MIPDLTPDLPPDLTPDLTPALEDRLCRYAAVDTQSDGTGASSPSTACQLDLARMLAAELAAMGAADVTITPYGAVLATIPATAAHPAPVVGLLAHMDTAPAYAASGVKPVVHRSYNGGPIAFADAPDLVLSPAVSPRLAEKVGHDIITASGTTLLGADDKAGIAILMTLARHLLAHPAIPHGALRLAFTPDEEIGRGVSADLPRDLGADFAYTLDGGSVGEIEYESFSADGAVVTITGVSAHPGYAQAKMVNALTRAARLVSFLPQATLTPETTAGRDGFVHLHEIRGTAAEATLRFILRDFELDGLESSVAQIA